ncbi:MAG: TetR/AcrR family transcriptional regulator [Corynebacterium sp.]|uniref:TetR/AcrR family transcriptional regulator n=1 Tax=Corynebacterium sp. TaxID=1720 RepID=UPI0026DF1FAA|nr:TetR/AcrR family transcriptional regulator [Corynebacterium sp.]MDO5668899.1 TetR/AcrR family transcriptional regulator [Corynebacterium sp.]
MSTSAKPYHHGDLRAALIRAAVDILEEGENFSLRAVARRTGVSPTAPYRHFPDREALDSAVAGEGFTDLHRALTATLDASPVGADPVAVMAELGVTYVAFAQRRPAVFRLMFAGGCSNGNDARLHSFLEETLGQLFPQQATPELCTGLWGLAHGLAFLHLERPHANMAGQVRAAVEAVLRL